jgi:hypothetical protein
MSGGGEGIRPRDGESHTWRHEATRGQASANLGSPAAEV